MQKPKVVLPGGTIGMVGGGQLGRMFAIAAAAMGYRVIVFCGHGDEPAAQVATGFVAGDLDDPAAIEEFASQCDVITLEFENIPAATIARCNQFAPTYPGSKVLATAQHRLIEKTTLRSAGLPVTPFAEVSDQASLAAAAAEFGFPLIVKTAVSGYDGKGQHRIDRAEEVANIPWHQCESWVAEKCIAFDREVSAIVARTPEGRCESFPIFENDHRNHILDLTSLPASISEAAAKRVAGIAREAATALDVVGLLCVEFFVSGEDVMINEVAPRPHNSGHITIEACETSQFAQHVRAVCNLPLGSTEMRSPAAAMLNLLGDLWNDDDSMPDWNHVFSDPGIALHLYGKSAPKPGRKMGHLSITGNDLPQLTERLHRARQQLESVN